MFQFGFHGGKSMRSKLVLAALLLTAPASFGSDTDCAKNSRTIVVLTDCSDTAVAGARVKIQLSCDQNQTITRSTNGTGMAVFDFSRKDIGASEITLPGFMKTIFNGTACNGTDADSTCKIKICPR